MHFLGLAKSVRRAREEKRLRRERKGYGRSCRGEHVNMDSLAALNQLGYSRPLVAEALKQVKSELCSVTYHLGTSFAAWNNWIYAGGAPALAECGLQETR